MTSIHRADLIYGKETIYRTCPMCEQKTLYLDKTAEGDRRFWCDNEKCVYATAPI